MAEDIEVEETVKRKRRFASVVMLSPGIIWLILFFLIPLISLFIKSLSVRPTRFGNVKFAWEWSNYSTAFTDYGAQFQRSFTYAIIATIIAIFLAFPLAYIIAFRAGRWKNFWMGIVMVPFFTSFLIRTLAWKTILGSHGPIFSHFVGPNATISILPSDFQVLRTPYAVIGGLVYNFLPFMILPLYVALEKIDPKLMNVARDLYYLGSAKTSMIGTVVQDQFLRQSNYPVASALSFIFMLIVVILFIIYSSIFDAEDLAG